MIENKQLYQFDETVEMNQPSPVETETETLSVPGNLKFLGRVGVSLLCLLILGYIARAPFRWAYWAKRQLHTAINATSGQTFGRLIKSPVIGSIVANSRNLIRLEEVTQKFMKPAAAGLNQPQLSHAVWPVSGKLVQGFGWYQPAGSNKPQFFKGVAIAGLPGTKVVAIHSGKVVEVYQESGLGWTLALENGDGYRSIYRNLGQVLVNISQNVQAGEVIAQLKNTSEPNGAVAQFEIYEAGQPIDPLSVLPRN